jgi:hypothetical protein
MYVYLFLKCGIFYWKVGKKTVLVHIFFQRYALNKVLCYYINNNGFTKYVLHYIYDIEGKFEIVESTINGPNILKYL